MAEPFIERLKERGIKSTSVLGALNTISYYLFHDDEQKKQAYSDNALPIDLGEAIDDIYLVALMTEAMIGNDVDLIPEKVLEVGTGSGFETAVLAEIVDDVYSIEHNRERYVKTQERLKELRVVNAKLRYGDGYLGWPEYAPYDGIIVRVAVEEIPEALKEQLKDGGKMVIPVGKASKPIVYLVTRHNQTFEQTMIGSYEFSRLLPGISK